MTNDVAVFLDLDNLVIGAKQSNLPFDINLVLDHIKKITDGRIVLRHAYGAGKQSQGQLQELAQAGFIVQSATRINNFSKNLADMQITVNAMDTLVDGHQYNTYVLMSGDRDFTPLVQSLRKRGKHVIGVGIRHTSSGSLVELCDEYIFYEDLLPQVDMTGAELEELGDREGGDHAEQQRPGAVLDEVQQQRGHEAEDQPEDQHSDDEEAQGQRRAVRPATTPGGEHEAPGEQREPDDHHEDQGRRHADAHPLQEIERRIGLLLEEPDRDEVGRAADQGAHTSNRCRVGDGQDAPQAAARRRRVHARLS